MERMEAMEEKLASVGTSLEHLTHSLDTLVQELRVTNNNVQQLTLSQARLEERVSRAGGELWTSDNGSRIRTLELHVKGIYVALGGLGFGIAGELWAILSNWSRFLGH